MPECLQFQNKCGSDIEVARIQGLIHKARARGKNMPIPLPHLQPAMPVANEIGCLSTVSVLLREDQITEHELHTESAILPLLTDYGGKGSIPAIHKHKPARSSPSVSPLSRSIYTRRCCGIPIQRIVSGLIRSHFELPYTTLRKEAISSWSAFPLTGLQGKLERQRG